jgi:hypothetical protein
MYCITVFSTYVNFGASTVWAQNQGRIYARAKGARAQGGNLKKREIEV